MYIHSPRRISDTHVEVIVETSAGKQIQFFEYSDNVIDHVVPNPELIAALPMTRGATLSYGDAVRKAHELAQGHLMPAVGESWAVNLGAGLVRNNVLQKHFDEVGFK